VISNKFHRRFILHIEASLFGSKNMGNAEKNIFSAVVSCDFMSSFLPFSFLMLFENAAVTLSML
jgi:hypothetical protein